MVKTFIYPAVLFGVFVSFPVLQHGTADDSSSKKDPLADASYVGTKACVECHQPQYQSYLQTTHSISCTETSADNEPPSQTYDHPATGFRYEIQRNNGDLIHREIVRDAEGNTLATTEKKIDYSVGSGTHGKSYLYKTGEFLHQSPLTWFSQLDSWDMSPGFDSPTHRSFTRKVKSECLFCHVGIINQKNLNPFDFEIVETSIGCERCHGPGSFHVAKHGDASSDASHSHQDGATDLTIVNPAKLSRELSEAICHQCHLQGVGIATTTGRNQWDFRPGSPLTDTRIDYLYQQDSENMKIVGHVEQLHASQCYQQTETLTCITCHDPHHPVPAEDRIKAYRDNCLSCHADEACGKPLSERMQTAGNSCFQCHMPKAETNVTHAALHHHQIGIHRKDGIDNSEDGSDMTPVVAGSHLSESEQARCLALGKVDYLRTSSDAKDGLKLANEAIASLIKLKQAGQLDPDGTFGLAWLAKAQNQRQIAKNLTTEILNSEKRPTLTRIQAASMLAEFAFQDKQWDEAVKLYRQVNDYHRDAYDLYYLGMCENNVGNTEAAIAAFNQSLEVDPKQPIVHAALIAIYYAQGERDKVAFHEKKVEKLLKLMKRLQAKKSPASAPSK